MVMWYDTDLSRSQFQVHRLVPEPSWWWEGIKGVTILPQEDQWHVLEQTH